MFSTLFVCKIAIKCNYVHYDLFNKFNACLSHSNHQSYKLRLKWLCVEVLVQTKTVLDLFMLLFVLMYQWWPVNFYAFEMKSNTDDLTGHYHYNVMIIVIKHLIDSIGSNISWFVQWVEVDVNINAYEITYTIHAHSKCMYIEIICNWFQ